MIYLKNIDLPTMQSAAQGKTPSGPMLVATACAYVLGREIEASITILQSGKELVVRQYWIDGKSVTSGFAHQVVLSGFLKELQVFADGSGLTVKDYFGQLLKNC